MKVFINPGHDLTYDSGAVNPATGVRECDIAAAVSAKVVDYLQAAGVEVESLQSDNLYYDSDYDLPCVCEVANNSGADVFISLHCNAAGGDAMGTETLVYSDDGSSSSKLARCIQEQIIDSLGTVDRGIKERPGLIVLKHTNMPACLVEMAFIDNPADFDVLENRQDDIAAAIARGITDYFSLN